MEPPHDDKVNSVSAGHDILSTLDSYENYLDHLPAAKETPARVAQVPTTNNEAPAVATGDLERSDDPELDDLGWSEDPKVPIPLIHGMNNEELWILVRRFNQQTYHVKAIPSLPPGRLDLNIADEEEFSTEKLRSTVERFYMTIIVGIAAVAKHIARLRSWNERTRTAYFCVTYFLAWSLNLVMSLLFTVLIVLVIHPPSRKLLFPPAPLASVSSSTGSSQTPKAGHLGSKDSLTGAAESYKGQAVEQEANNFVTGITSIAVGSATGQGAPSTEGGDNNGSSEDREVGSALPDATSVVGGAHEAQANASGVKAEHDKAKVPVQEGMWEKVRPTMHVIAGISDGWERFANALSPTPPFSQNTARIRLVAVMTPMLLASLMIDYRLIYKSATFAFGFGIFGQPVINRLGHAHIRVLLDRIYPNWKEALELRNNILSGVPTNAQLTLTILRVGEANKAPLPPPPPPSSSPPPEPPTIQNGDAATAGEDETDLEDKEGTEQDSKIKKGSRKIVGVFKAATKASVQSIRGVDRLKATAGSEPSKTRIGIVQANHENVDAPSDGPASFGARHHGMKGRVVISTSATTPCVSFERLSGSPLKQPEPVFSIAIDDIREVRKIGGLGWKGKLVVGWALESEVADGLEIVDVLGKREVLTAMKRRDEVFNRLIALSPKHQWESW